MMQKRNLALSATSGRFKDATEVATTRAEAKNSARYSLNACKH